ncbi:hypothetical protein [Nonomuraea sp. LPB2021202275-12-8]|uniref:hypothetical protein n=1 Tax=Nonomuraea sp. LPB2021202275-12-8 TaxID=3120159 RepID=UPI00300C7268
MSELPPSKPESPLPDGWWLSSNALRILMRTVIGLGVLYVMVRVGGDPEIVAALARFLKI